MVHSCRHYLGTHTPRVLGVGVGFALVHRHVLFAMVGHWLSGNISIINVLMQGAVNHLPAILATPLRQLPTLLCPRPPRGPFHLHLPTPHPSDGLGEGREVTDVVNVKPPSVSSSPSVPKHKHGERGRDTPFVLDENGDASATSLASAGGGEYAPAQPDYLAVKSPPSPRPHRPNLPPSPQVDHWREGEIRAPFPAPSSPRSERGEGGERESRAWTAQGHQIFTVNLRGAAPLPGDRSRPRGRDRYSLPARPRSPSLQSRPAENLSIHCPVVTTEVSRKL